MQGFNMGRRHAPSDLDPALRTTPTTLTTSKRLKPTPANPTIRFEMPFAIWCSTCPSQSPQALIGQGVRFNALKAKVGNYHSSPIWSFTLKHAACGGRIEMRTDPRNSDFVVSEGAKRRDFGDDVAIAARTGGVILETGGLGAAVKKVEEGDPFASFEGKKAREVEEKDEERRLEDLRSARERDWRDPGGMNKKLRAAFREGRRWRDWQREDGEKLAERYGFGFEIGEEVQGDDVAAKEVEYGVDEEEDVGGKALFAVASAGPGDDTRVAKLRRKMVANTRAAIDPFASEADTKTRPRIQGLKRKSVAQHEKTLLQEPPETRDSEAAIEQQNDLHNRLTGYETKNNSNTSGQEQGKDQKSLVDYGSESETDA